VTKSGGAEAGVISRRRFNIFQRLRPIAIPPGFVRLPQVELTPGGFENRPRGSQLRKIERPEIMPK